ncbi:MAG: hypothetical protein ACXW11_10750 [Methylotenera sp.]
MLSTAEMNNLGTAIIAPITQGGDFSRYAEFAVSLTGTCIFSYQLTIDSHHDCLTCTIIRTDH